MRTPARQLLPRRERQLSIIAGAARAFARGGFAATSMEDVAQAAGITKLIVYRHFDSKAALYKRVLERTLARLAEELQRHLERNPTGAAVRSVLAVGRESPDGLRLLLVHSAREPEFADYAREMRDHVVSRWEPHIPLEDPMLQRWATELAVTYVWEAVLSWLDRGSPERDEEFTRRCTAGLYAMIRAFRDPDRVKPLFNSTSD